MKQTINVKKISSLKTLDDKIKYCQENKDEFRELKALFESVKEELKQTAPNRDDAKVDTFRYKISVSYQKEHVRKGCYIKRVTFK